MADEERGEEQRSLFDTLVHHLEQLTFIRFLFLFAAVAGSASFVLDVAMMILRDEYHLALTASQPRDRGSYVQCIGHGIADSAAPLDDITVSVVCEELEEGEFVPTVTPSPAPGEPCQRCTEVTAEHAIGCAALGQGEHEIRTKAHGLIRDEGLHQPDPVFSNSVTVECSPTESS